MRSSLFALGGNAILAVAFAASSGVAVAAPLTRSNCWTVKFEDGGFRMMCFSGPSRATMNNRNHVRNNDQWSTCQWTGTYLQNGDKVTVSFAQGSDKCSNGAPSPQFNLVCDFTGESLDCKSSAIVNGQTYESNYKFE